MIKKKKTKAAKKTNAKKETSTPTRRSRLPQVDRRRVVEETAYFMAEKRGFQPGHELEDWLAAESLVTTEHSQAR